MKYQKLTGIFLIVFGTAMIILGGSIIWTVLRKVL